MTLGNGARATRSYDAQGAMASLSHFTASVATDVQYTYARNQVRDITTSSAEPVYNCPAGATLSGSSCIAVGSTEPFSFLSPRLTQTRQIRGGVLLKPQAAGLSSAHTC